MRRSQSRSSSRNKSPSNLNSTTLVKRSTKLPMISGSQDEGGAQVTQYVSNNESGLVVGVCSMQGKRPYQEDEYSIRQFLNQSTSGMEHDTNNETHFFGLFDGHAGGKCSKYVGANLPGTLADDSLFYSNLPQAVRRSFHATNEQFLKIADKGKMHDGSTGITAIIRDRKILVANVGDCRALVLSNGRPIQMSIDQKPTSPEEQKRIAALGGTVVYCMGVARVNRVLAVSRAFGNRTLRTVIRPDAEMMQREVTRDDDYLVMASDGLWDVLRNKDVCDICYAPHLQNASPQHLAEELVHTALNRGSMDNVTCIVVSLRDYVNRILSKNVVSAASSLSQSSSNLMQNSNGNKLERTYSDISDNCLTNSNSAMQQLMHNMTIKTTESTGVESPTGSLSQAAIGRAQNGKNLLFSQNGNSTDNRSSNNSYLNNMPNKQMSLGNIGHYMSDSASDGNNNNNNSNSSSPQPLKRQDSNNGMKIPILKVASSNNSPNLASASSDSYLQSPLKNNSFLKSSSSSTLPVFSMANAQSSNASPLLVRSFTHSSNINSKDQSLNGQTLSPARSSPDSIHEDDEDDNLTTAPHPGSKGTLFEQMKRANSNMSLNSVGSNLTIVDADSPKQSPESSRLISHATAGRPNTTSSATGGIRGFSNGFVSFLSGGASSNSGVAPTSSNDEAARKSQQRASAKPTSPASFRRSGDGQGHMPMINGSSALYSVSGGAEKPMVRN